MGDGIPPAGSHASVPSRPSSASVALEARLAAAGRSLGAREAAHGAALEAARRRCEALRALALGAVEAFHAAARDAGAPHLKLEVGAARLDEKHVRAFEFEVRRGRHVGIVVVKSRGEVTLVGPFRTGKTEGPCRSLLVDAEVETAEALGDFLERLAEEAATP